MYGRGAGNAQRFHACTIRVMSDRAGETSAQLLSTRVKGIASRKERGRRGVAEMTGTAGISGHEDATLFWFITFLLGRREA